MAEQSNSVNESIEEVKSPEGSARIIFQLGTNNWQSENEAAPGSGILHESHHNAYNALPNTKCYSIWPSGLKRQTNAGNKRDNVVIYELEQNIPVCESASPVSERRWHSMKKEDVVEYRETLEKMVSEYLDKIESENGGAKISLVISHHTFMNPVVMVNVLKKRRAAGKSVPPHAVFVHGTGLKMYQNERRQESEKVPIKEREYPPKFEKWINDEKIFSSCGEACYPTLAYAISGKQIDEFCNIFKGFPRDRVILSHNGFDANIFYPQKNATLAGVLKDLQHIPPTSTNEKPSPIPTHFKQCVLFVGKLADWKRIDSLLIAAATYEREFPNLCTLIIGGGPQTENLRLQSMSKGLKNKNVFFCGPRMQPVLARLYSVCNVGAFPSKNEPFGMVLIEAMACGQPVIGANSGGPRDFITTDVGYLVEESDDRTVFSDRLAETITTALKEDWKTTKREACLTVAKRFTVTGQCDALLAATDKLLKK